MWNIFCRLQSCWLVEYISLNCNVWQGKREVFLKDDRMPAFQAGRSHSKQLDKYCNFKLVAWFQRATFRCQIAVYFLQHRCLIRRVVLFLSWDLSQTIKVIYSTQNIVFYCQQPTEIVLEILSPYCSRRSPIVCYNMATEPPILPQWVGGNRISSIISKKTLRQLTVTKSFFLPTLRIPSTLSEEVWMYIRWSVWTILLTVVIGAPNCCAWIIH